MSSTIVVTGADSNYADSVLDLVRSIRALSFDCDIGIIDGGLPSSCTSAISHYDCVLRPVELPDACKIVAGDIPRGWWTALCKPYITNIFEGYKTYIFLDADTWVQKKFALEYLKAFCANGSLAIVSQRSRFHDGDCARGNGVEFNMMGQALRSNWYTMFAHRSKLSRQDKRILASMPILNAGVFAAEANAGIWELWRNCEIEAVKALPRGRQYTADQIGLGLAVYRHKYPLALLPEECNWTSVWRYDDRQGCFTQTQPPFSPIGIVHLAGISPENPVGEVVQLSGDVKPMNLTYKAQCSRNFKA